MRVDCFKMISMDKITVACDIEITILNRWGSIIYQTRSNAWDGTTEGKTVAVGSYVYQVTIKDFADNEHIRTGSVLILND